MKRHTAETRVLVLYLRGLGLSHASIAKFSGVSYGTVRYMCTPSLRRAQIQRARKARLENPDRQRAAEEVYRARGPRENVKGYDSSWHSRNPEKAAAKEARRRASKLRATPSWLTPKQEDEIEALYSESRRLTLATGIPHHVDHIHPLQGEVSCGLHVPWNLQVLTASENCSKSNSLVE